MAFVNPSVADFKAQFNRDFPYGTDPNVAVLDSDIAKSFQITNMNINQGLFSDQASYSVGYLYLSAHNMVMTLRSSSQGINGQFSFLNASRGAGQVNEAFSIPQRILDNPFWSVLAKTNYGIQYLMMVFPKLSGQMFTVWGPTKP